MPRHSENEQRDQKMREMREAGYSLQQIADEFNLSRQRVNCIVGNREKGALRFREDITYSVYPAIDRWFHENRATYAQFVEMCGWRYTPSMKDKIKRILNGSEVKKTHIDRILRATGLSYEVAFGGKRKLVRKEAEINRKILAKDRRDMREMRKAGYGLCVIADDYNISRGYVGKVVRNIKVGCGLDGVSDQSERGTDGVDDRGSGGVFPDSIEPVE